MDVSNIMEKAKAAAMNKPPPAPELGDVVSASEPDNVKWYVIHSRVLDDRFVLCMRKSLYREVTERFPDTVIYFLPEMEELLVLRDEMEREAWCRMVRKVHLTKKTFRGWVVPEKTKGSVKHAANH